MASHFYTQSSFQKSFPNLSDAISKKLSENEKVDIEKIINNNHYFLPQLNHILACSEFAKNLLTKYPVYLIILAKETKSDLWTCASYLKEMPKKEDTESFDQQLRKLRNMLMLRIIWRDLNALSSLEQTTKELCFLAESSLWSAHQHHYRHLKKKYGEPTNTEGIIQPLLILGMGKLGAYELNLSSDIDLIFCYPESGHTNHEQKSIDNQSFFTKLGQKVIQSLDRITAEGFVFRVDMRLRPYGQSGALAYSFSAMENYYLTQGREWERYAMVKARVIFNADQTMSTTQQKNIHESENKFTTELMQILRDFTYRRYIDFSVIEALRKLKKSIAQEVVRRGLENDVKLGSGGIREVEFIAQTFQLVHGGRERELQDNRLLHILPLLEKHHYLPDGIAKKLRRAYIFLRKTEHAIQAYQDKQTQKLPFENPAQEALLNALNFKTWDSFTETLNDYRKTVHEEFNAIIAEDQDAEQNEVLNTWVVFWQECFLAGEDEQAESACCSTLTKSGYQTPKEVLGKLKDLCQRVNQSAMHASGRERLDEFMPLLLTKVSASENPSRTLIRILPLIQNVARRSAYLLLLVENPDALNQVIKLSAASPWIAEQLSDHPALLDELLDTRHLYHLPSKDELSDELWHFLMRIDEDDLGEQMDALRHFRSSHALRVAACEITGALPLMNVSDYLSFLAEAILGCTLDLAWRGMVKKHGYPDSNTVTQPKFIIIGYGKLGGIELSHGSDLDLVFLHDASVNGQTSGDGEGKRSIDNQTFYMRLGQKIIHMLGTRTPAGTLYEIDMRLRPSGNSGQLSTSLSAFKKYQENEAWTWEHQALVRARVVAGDPALEKAFNKERENVLRRSRDLANLKKEVSDMREKMRAHLGSSMASNTPYSTTNATDTKQTPTFHLKQDAGGIVDIEFMVQYAVLAWSRDLPELVRYTDNIRILESLAQTAQLPTHEVEQLIEAYKAYRSAGHRLTLQQESNLLEHGTFVTERQNVVQIWQKTLNKQH